MAINKKVQELPNVFNILTLRNKRTGVWIAQLVDYDLCTEADSFSELVFNVNDLIYTVFDIPKSLQSQITYLPAKVFIDREVQKASSVEEEMKFNILLSPQLAQYRHA